MTARSILAAILALPVLADVYARSIGRRLPVVLLAAPVLAGVYVRVAARPRAVARSMLVFGVGGLLLVAGGTIARPTDTSAHGPGSTPTLGPDAFVPLTIPAGSSVSAGFGSEPAVLGSETTRDELAPSRTVGSAVTTGPAVSVATRSAAPVLPAPAVVRFRPLDGSRDVTPTAVVSVRFTQAMDTASADAFRVSIDGTAVGGRSSWAENDTVLVLRLDRVTPAGATVRLVVGADARSFAGIPLGAEASATFRVAVPPSPTPRPTPRPATRPASASTSVSSSGWAWPLIGPITQYFGQSLTKYGYHQGIDIDGNTGDPVRAAKGGRVALAGYGDSCGGIQVHIDHGNGVVSWYRHLSAVTVRVGQVVARGAIVGKVGNTGCSLGSHLHFAITVNGTFVDPLPYLPRR